MVCFPAAGPCAPKLACSGGKSRRTVLVAKWVRSGFLVSRAQGAGPRMRPDRVLLNFRLGRRTSGPHAGNYPDLEYGCPFGAAAGGSGGAAVPHSRSERANFDDALLRNIGCAAVELGSMSKKGPGLGYRRFWWSGRLRRLRIPCQHSGGFRPPPFGRVSHLFIKLVYGSAADLSSSP